MTKEELQKILDAHKAWTMGSPHGLRADLRGADLRVADLRWADLRGADLSGADLSGADLTGVRINDNTANNIKTT